MITPVIPDGAIAYSQDRILDVGAEETIGDRFPDSPIEDLGDSIILPGLINAHTHLELSDCDAQACQADSFVDWIMTMRQKSSGNFVAATQLGIEQCLKFGVTCVGDISQQMEITRPILAKSRLRGVSFGEVLGLAKRRSRFDELFPQAIDRGFASSRLKIGISPHAPFTVDLDGYQQCVQASKEMKLPLATHLAENSGEESFLRDHAGEFRALWNAIGSWQDDVPTFRGSPVEMARAIGLLDLPAVLAHVNYCTDTELEMLSRGHSSIVYCPRTHAYFKHPPHRWREMIQRGINVAIGTDSCASSPDLNLVDELRLLRRIAPDIPAEELWRLVTVHGAKALGFPDLGVIAAGFKADFVIFPATGYSPLETILQSTVLPLETRIAG